MFLLSGFPISMSRALTISFNGNVTQEATAIIAETIELGFQPKRNAATCTLTQD
jgi:hypothetical protein